MEGGGRLMNNQTNDRINENHVAIDQALLLFHMLSNPTRFNILFLLSVEDMNVKELERRIGQSQSAISHQLTLMRNAKLVQSIRIGRKRYYRLQDDHVRLILGLVMNHVSEEK